MTIRDELGPRDDAAVGTPGRTYRPHAGTWNTRVQPAPPVPVVRHDPFAALGHEASRHGHVAGAPHARHDHPHDHAVGAPHDPVPSLWPHADDAGAGAEERRTAWSPQAVWGPTPSVPFPRPVPPAEIDPPAWS